MSRRSRLTVGVAALACLVAAPAAGAATKQIPQSDCFWSFRTASAFASGASNYAFPDAGAVYWSAKVTMPAGSRIVLKGRYAHARYQSINSYDKASNAPVDALNDVSTAPDRGSVNPYRPGSSRTARKRSYTITVLNETAPSTGRAPNTLYAGVPGQPDQMLLQRVYLPDSMKRSELTGAVGLPAVELRLADGSVRKGKAACAALNAKGGKPVVTTLPADLYESLREPAGAPAGFPAAPRPVWRTFYNVGFILACWYRGDCEAEPERTGGQYSNIDNEYTAAFVNRSFSAGPVLVLKGTLPRTARSGKTVKRADRGQMRYWSICQNESLRTGRGAGCLYDSQVPVDSKGRYTIVSSLAGDRPPNARAKCGVGYLPWPKNGDGAGHREDGFLILRNMLPAAGFDQAIQDTKVPGDEAKVMGKYLPRGSYTTKAAFAKKGC